MNTRDEIMSKLGLAPKDFEPQKKVDTEQKVEEQQAEIDMLSELLDTLLTEIIPAMVEGDLE